MEVLRTDRCLQQTAQAGIDLGSGRRGSGSFDLHDDVGTQLTNLNVMQTDLSWRMRALAAIRIDM